jgi:hypothetical protein
MASSGYPSKVLGATMKFATVASAPDSFGNSHGLRRFDNPGPALRTLTAWTQTQIVHGSNCGISRGIRRAPARNRPVGSTAVRTWL